MPRPSWIRPRAALMGLLLAGHAQAADPDLAFDVTILHPSHAGWAYVGSAVAGGDFDGDGYDDLAVGAFGERRVYLYPGSPQGLRTEAVTILEASQGDDDTYGSALAALDVDGDGYDDLAVGASDAGTAFVYQGGPAGLSEASERYFLPFQPSSAISIYGHAVTDAGDMDGDGLADVGFGAPYGGLDGLYILAGPADTDTEGEDATAYLRGMPGSMCGHGAEIADVNGDDLEDALVGCYSDVSYGGSGVTYVFYGPVSGDYDPDDADAVLYSTSASEYSGRWIRGDGDLNADGVNDVMVAAPFGSGAAMTGGLIYVFLGPVSGEIDLPSADARLLGSTAGGYLGEYRTLIMGDSDGDGADDVLAAAYYASEAGVFFSPTSGDYEMASADIQITTTSAMYFGSGLDLADIDGNGVGDLIVGSAYENSNAGGSYFYWDLRPGAYTEADAEAHFLGEAGASAGITNTFADMSGDGFPDVVVGASGLDGNGGFYVQDQVQ